MKLSRLFLFIAGLLLALPAAHAGFLLLFNGQGGGGGGGGGAFKTVFITSGTTWNVPNDFTSTNTLVAIGGGAGGGGGNSGQGGGGGGGAFATIGNLSLTPGSAIPIQIGQGGAGATNAVNAVAGNGTDTIFNTTTLIAKGGVAGVFLGGSGPRGGAGGAAASSTPTAGAHSGGKGADIPSAATGGGGGGAAGGVDGNGGAGGTISSSSSSQGGSGGGGSDGGSVGGGVTASLNGGAGGTAFDATAGGAGGTGGASPTVGSAGSHGSGGGGGGGSSTASVTTATGGVGGAGLNYTQTVDSSHAGPGGGGGGAGGDSGATSVGAVGAAGGLYGGGGGTGGLGTTTNGAGGAGKNGILIITYQSSGGGAGGATTYFVDSVNGNDSNSGLTQALAWQTVTPVNAKVYNAGDSVLFNGGQTFAGPITLSAAANYSGTTPPTLAQPLTIGSYGIGTPTLHITTASTDALHLTNIGNITVQNLIITGSGASSQKGLRLSNTTTTTQYSNVNFNNIEVSGMSSTGMQVEADGDTSHGFTNLAFNGVNVHSSTTGSSSPGIFIAGFFPYQWTSAVYDHLNVTISNSTVSGAGSDGIDMWNVNGFTVTNNRVTGNGLISTGGTAAIETQASTAGTIAFNEFDHHVLAPSATFDSDGINIDRGSSNIVAEYNWVHDNAGAGLTVFQGSTGSIPMTGITYRYNITQNNGTAGASTNVPTEIVLGSSGQIAITGINVYNNTFYASKNASNVNSIVLFEAANITGNFENNILYGTANPRSVDAVTFNPSTMAFLGNDYFGTTKFRWNNVSYTTVSAWATATSQDASALTSDPTLTSPGTGGTTNGYNPGSLGAYKLIGGSPMIGVGQVIASPGSQDYYGLTIPTSTGTGYNVGADGSSPAAAVPSAPTISSPLTGATVTTQVATLSGTGINGDTVNVTLDGATSNGVATVASGVWSYNTPSLANASHTVTATQTNGTGTSVASNSVTFTTSFSSGATPSTSLHYAAGDGQGLLGFNLADVSSVNALNALPAGYKGLVFIGTCAGADSTFQAFVNPFNGNSKLWGFYVVDEPVVANCTTANLKAEVDYIHANITGAKTFVVLENLGTPTNPDYTGYVTPANTDLDYVGIDPYPVRTQFTGGINLSVIGAGITAAQVPGWTIAQMVPVYQAFGNYQCTGAGPGSDWNLPTASQEQSILVTFGNFMPTPVFDYAYAWGQQCAPPNGAVGDDVISTTGYLQTFYQQRNGVPPPPVILQPTGTVTTAQATVSGTGAVVGDTINVCIDGILVNASCTGGTTSGTSTVNASLAWSFNTAALANGQHKVTATESNSTGSSLLGNQVNFTTNVTVATTSTLDPANTTTSLTLSSDHLTDTVTTATGFPQSISTTSYSTGKFHFEVQLGPTGGSATSIGIATASHNLANQVGSDTASIGVWGNNGGGAQGEVLYNGTAVIPLTANLLFAAGDLIEVEVDIGAGRYWAQDVTRGTGWNGSGTANPSTGTGGAAFTPGGVPWFVITSPPATLNRTNTVNFGASNFSASCSTNFTPWNGSSTACPAGPPPGTSGTGLSAATTLLPSDLPTTHWQTTARPWRGALNIPLSTYKSRFMAQTAWVGAHLDGGGCLVSSWDPYGDYVGADKETGAQIGASFAVSGDTTSLSTAIATQNCATLDYTDPNSPTQKVFPPGPINTGILYLQNAPGVPGSVLSTWESRMNVLPSGTNVSNQRVVAAWGVQMGHAVGMSAYANAESLIDSWWLDQGFNLVNFQLAPFYLFQDGSSTPDTLSVEVQGRGAWLNILYNGYSGASVAAITNAQTRASMTKMLTQGPTGDIAPNGRTDNHNWVEAGEAEGYAGMAQSLNTSNPFLAGQFEHASQMGFNGISRFVNVNCCNSALFYITKNHFDPSLRVGYQTASTQEYDLENERFTALNYYVHGKGVAVTEQPAPSEIGGFAFALNSDFSTAFMNAGGTAAQINLRGDSTGSNGNFWTVAGINRIGRVGWENRLGPLDGAVEPSSQASFAPTWITSGTTWTRLGENPASCTGAFTTTFANPALTLGKVVWTCASGPTFTQNLTITPDGLLSQTTCASCPSTWGMTFPLMVDDGTLSPNTFGATAMTTSINSGGNGIASTTGYAAGDQQNYMTISSNATTMVSEANTRATVGDLTPVRAFTSDATQVSFVYPRNSSDPTAASVRSGMTVTGTNTYTNSALSSSVVSGTNGTYYIGRTAAGGWATTLTLPGGTMTFNNPCFFIAQLNGSGQVTTLEVDRNVQATSIPGSLGPHTNVNLTANNPQHNL